MNKKHFILSLLLLCCTSFAATAQVKKSQPQTQKKTAAQTPKNRFIVISKKDYYLAVYETKAGDTLLVKKYPCCVALNPGQKQKRGDMKTPHCTMQNPFKITQIQDAHNWHHDFGDGRGSIRAYGDYFLRLETPGFSGIGIHGSTNNRESVPGRGSEGCIRLLDEDIIDLRKNYAFVGMKVVIKAEEIGPLSFEKKSAAAKK